MDNYKKLLIRLADTLDRQGKYAEADIVDRDWREFLELLENGELDFDFTFSGGARDPRGPYSNMGVEVQLSEILGPQ